MQYVFIGGGLRLVNRVVADDANDEVDIPSGSQSGDLLVTLATLYKNNSAPTTSLTGFTLIKSAGVTLSTDRYYVAAWYRVCDGTEGAPVAYADGILSGFTYLLRAPRAIIGVQASPGDDWNAQVTGGDPSAQTVLASGQTAPLAVFALNFNDNGSLGFTTASPAFGVLDEDIDSAVTPRSDVGISIYNGSPSDHSIDTGDNAYANGLISGFLQPQF